MKEFRSKSRSYSLIIPILDISDRDSTPPLSPPSPALGGNNNSGSMEGYFSGNGGTSGAPGSDSQHQMDYFSLYGGRKQEGHQVGKWETHY